MTRQTEPIQQARPASGSVADLLLARFEALELGDCDTMIRAVQSIEMRSRPTESDPEFVDSALLLQASGFGYVNLTSPLGNELASSLVGVDSASSVRDFERHDVRVALLDCAANSAWEPSADVLLEGSIEAKALARAELAADLVEESLDSPSDGVVLLVGVVASLVLALTARGYAVIGADYDPAVTDGAVSGVSVPHGDALDTLSSVDSIACVLATGMTLANDTYLPLRAAARERGIPFVLYCQSAASAVRLMGPDVGPDRALLEFFPNLFFPGSTRVQLWEPELRAGPAHG